MLKKLRQNSGSQKGEGERSRGGFGDVSVTSSIDVSNNQSSQNRGSKLTLVQYSSTNSTPYIKNSKGYQKDAS